MQFRYAVAGAAGSIIMLSGCGASGLAGSDLQRLNEAEQAVDEHESEIAALDGRVTAAEGDIDDLQENGTGGGGLTQEDVDETVNNAVGTAIDDATGDLQGQIDDLSGRVGMVEMRWPPKDDDVVVDDRAAAGFPSAVPVDNVQQGFAYLNALLSQQDIDVEVLSGELDAANGRIDTIEVAYQSNLETTIVNVVNQKVQEGGITVDADFSFDPLTDSDPMADPNDAMKQYGEAVYFDEAIRALRFSNQIKYIPATANTRLGNLTRNYVQEAVSALDKDVYDVIYGNLAIDLNEGTTVNGADLDAYISTVIEGDTTLLQNIFNTTYFQQAVAVEIADTVNAGVATNASQVNVDTPAQVGGAANVMVALSNIYASVQANAADINALETAVAGNTSAIANNAAGISNNAAAIAANNTAIGNTNAAVAANAAAIGANATDIDGLQTQVATNTTNIATNTANIATNTGNIATNTANITTNTTNLSNVQTAVNNLNTAITNVTTIVNNIQNGNELVAADVPFDNTAHAAFDGNNATDNVQGAIEDVHEKITQLVSDLAGISAGGVVTDAANITYTNNGQTTVEGALDDLYTSIVGVQTVVGGTYNGQDVNVAITNIDAALIALSTDLDALEVALDTLIVDLAALEARVAANEVQLADHETRIDNLEAAVTTNTAAIATNAAGVTANSAAIANNTNAINNNTNAITNNTNNIANNTAGVAANAADIDALQAAAAANAADIDTLQAAATADAADIDALQAAVAANTAAIQANDADIANNAAGVAGNAADIDTLQAKVAALEAFNNNGGLQTFVTNIVNNAINAAVADLEAQIAAVEANATGHAFILGVSAQQSDGRFAFGGETGVRAATAMCQATFANEATAHLCTPAETHEAVALGNYDNGANFDGVQTWTVTGMTQQYGTQNAYTNASSTLVTSCNNLLYNSGDVATGAWLTVDLDAASFGGGGQNIAGDQVLIIPNRPCNTTRKVLCCR